MTQQERITRKLNEIGDQVEQLAAECSALEYAAHLVREKHKSAADMVRDVPNNIYIEEWKREEKYTAEKLAKLEEMIRENESRRAVLCSKYDKLSQTEAE